MRKSWRNWALIGLLGLWPHLGCHQLPADKSVQDAQPNPARSESARKQELTASDITQAAWMSRVDALEKERKTADAIALCERMREPGSPYALQATRRLGLIYERMNDRDRAEKEYRAVLTQNPNDADTIAKLGDLYKARGQWGIALKFYSDAVKRSPEHVTALTGLAMVQAQLGDYQGSFEAFKRVLHSEPEAHCEVAVVLQMQGKQREAIQAYEEALRKDPAMPRAAAELAKLRQTVGAAVIVDPVGRRGQAELMPAPLPVSETTGRSMDVRPTLALPPLSSESFDLPANR
jgi:tetratricopeptide (TPR) repeat protein